MQALPRRRFLSQLASSTLGLGCVATGSYTAQAIEPLARSGPPRMQLSLAAYSFRQFFKYDRGNVRENLERSMDLFDFIDFCAQHDCDAETTGYYFPSPLDDAYVLRLKRHAHLRGVSLSGTAVGNTFTLPAGDRRSQEIAAVKQWIDRAALLGAPHIRIFAGDRPARTSREQARALCLSAIEECCAYAAQRGVFLGLENHGGIVTEPDDLLDLVRAIQSPWFGINLDTGNFHTADPYADLERCLPYAVNIQVKVEMQPRGQAKGPADLERLGELFRSSGYQGFVVLEYEAAEDPWGAVPRYLDQLRQCLTA
jgi:sugar phosphate isomerase/epimerase